MAVAVPSPGEALTSFDGGKDAEWERKQRLREYRVAARREKRLRKADERKQRKLNATLLRRMTKNPAKYTKNAERNRVRAIELERRRIWSEAVRQAQRLAAIHDPSGEMFNVSPVTTLEDGTVLTLEALERRREREAAKNGQAVGTSKSGYHDRTDLPADSLASTSPETFMDPERARMLNGGSYGQTAPKKLSKSQAKKLEAMKPQPPPPKPNIPEGIALPPGEENWLSLWDITDAEIERGVLREKRRKAEARKSLRQRQQAGKQERRAARDEKRKVYRELKTAWKVIIDEGRQLKRKLQSLEEQEAKRLAVEVFTAERKAALECCAELGFTFDNTPGIDEIQPKVQGLKGVQIELDAVEPGSRSTDINPRKGNRVDLGAVPDDSQAQLVRAGDEHTSEAPGEFMSLGTNDDQEYRPVTYNHKLRRKIQRAVEAAQIQKELLVRQRAIEHCEANGIPVPAILKAPHKPVVEKGHRVLDGGKVETDKQERVRSRMELAEFNEAAKVLRRQAKQTAIEAGLRKYAEITGRLPKRSSPEPDEASAEGSIPRIGTEPTEDTMPGDGPKEFALKRARVTEGDHPAGNERESKKSKKSKK